MSESIELLLERGYQSRRQRHLEGAKADFAEAVRLARQSGEPLDLAASLTALAQIERDTGKADAALRNYEEAAAIYRAEGNSLRLAHTVRHLGDVHRHDGHREAAESCYAEGLEIYRGSSKTPPLELANAIRGYAILKQESGLALEAKNLWEEARALYEAAGITAGVVECKRRIAEISTARIE